MPLAEQQKAFAAHLRDPEHVPPPAGIEPRRMAIYRELFFNNLVDLLGGSFPVARRILGLERWRRLVREFYARHHAHTPYFLRGRPRLSEPVVQSGSAFRRLPDQGQHQRQRTDLPCAREPVLRGDPDR